MKRLLIVFLSIALLCSCDEVVTKTAYAPGADMSNRVDIRSNGELYQGCIILEEKDNGDLLVDCLKGTVLFHGSYVIQYGPQHVR